MLTIWYLRVCMGKWFTFTAKYKGNIFFYDPSYGEITPNNPIRIFIFVLSYCGSVA